MTTILVTDDTTRAELADTLAILCAEAKAVRRRGLTGVRSENYAAWHRRIDAVLRDWEKAKA